MRGFHQGEITLIEHGTENREKQVTVPGVIMESRTGERNISNPKPNGLRRACCRREREIKRQREGEKQRALWGQSVSAAGFNKCCERSKLQLFSVMHARCLNTESLLKIRKESWQEQSSFGLFYLIGSVSASSGDGGVQCTFVTRGDERRYISNGNQSIWRHQSDAQYCVVKRPCGVRRSALHHICAKCLGHWVTGTE